HVSPYQIAYDPLYGIRPSLVEEYLIYFGIVSAISLSLVLLAIVRARAVLIRASGKQTQARSRWPKITALFARSWLGSSPRSPGRNPIVWREWRQKPSLWVKSFWLVFIGGALLFSIDAILEILTTPLATAPVLRTLNGAQSFPAWVNSLLVGIGLFLVCIGTVTR